MESLNDIGKPEKQIGKNLIVATVAALVVIGAVIGAIVAIPSTSEQKQSALEGAVREGSAEFEALTKKIVITNFDPTEADTPLGTVVMGLNGRIRNNSDAMITALEVQVSILNIRSEPIKDKIVVALPNDKISTLKPGAALELAVSMDGFKKEDDRSGIRWKVTAIKVE